MLFKNTTARKEVIGQSVLSYSFIYLE